MTTSDSGVHAAPSQGMDFCTLGMFILDDIYPAPSATDQRPRLNVVGGAGTYSAIGARLFSPSPKSKSVGWIVDTGTDFQDELRSLVTSWDTGVLIRERDSLTTRGWNGYGEDDHRAFRYLTEKQRITADDLTPTLLASQSFHLICSASRCRDLVSRILLRRRQELQGDPGKPLFIWEPVPDLCVSSELASVKEVLPLIDVLSPNHEELGALFDFHHSGALDKHALADHVEDLLRGGIGAKGQGAIVVRAGKEGCFTAMQEKRTWLPAYHINADKVIDPTGGGNGFLGGFAVGLVRTGDLIEAALWGSIAASLCIEQVGLPTLTRAGSGSDDEEWNDCKVIDRLRRFRDRVPMHSI